MPGQCPCMHNRDTSTFFGEVERKWRLMYDLASQCTEVSPHARPTMADVAKAREDKGGRVLNTHS